MDSNKLRACGVDYEEGMKRFSNHAKIYEKYLKRLLNLDIYAELKQTLASGDIQASFDASHKLKAFIGNLSIPELFEEVSQMTDILRTGEIEGVPEKMECIDKMIEKISAVIKSEIKEGR